MFSRSNLFLTKQLYLAFPKIQTLSGQLSWSHYVELLKAEDELERSFYLKQSEQERWSVRELKWQMKSMLFYRILKCFVLFDLKTGEVEHSDVGQMNLYLNYFAKEEGVEDDNPPIGIVLGAYKGHILMEYATDHISNQLFVSKYQLYLPDRKKLVATLEKHLIYE